MLELGTSNLRTFVDSVRFALREHIVVKLGGNMDGDSNSFAAMMKKTAAVAPICMSLLALSTVLIAIAMDLHRSGQVVIQTDEGSAAHIWQLLMTTQLPIVLYFLLRWMRAAPDRALGVLGVQAGAWLAAWVPVDLLHL
jgi:hypothetical protein